MDVVPVVDVLVVDVPLDLPPVDVVPVDVVPGDVVPGDVVVGDVVVGDVVVGDVVAGDVAPVDMVPVDVSRGAEADLRGRVGEVLSLAWFRGLAALEVAECFGGLAPAGWALLRVEPFVAFRVVPRTLRPGRVAE